MNIATGIRSITSMIREAALSAARASSSLASSTRRATGPALGQVFFRISSWLAPGSREGTLSSAMTMFSTDSVQRAVDGELAMLPRLLTVTRTVTVAPV